MLQREAYNGENLFDADKKHSMLKVWFRCHCGSIVGPAMQYQNRSKIIVASGMMAREFAQKSLR